MHQTWLLINPSHKVNWSENLHHCTAAVHFFYPNFIKRQTFLKASMFWQSFTCWMIESLKDLNFISDIQPDLEYDHIYVLTPFRATSGGPLLSLWVCRGILEWKFRQKEPFKEGRVILGGKFWVRTNEAFWEGNFQFRQWGILGGKIFGSDK